MQCEKCGSQLPPESLFCSHCGAPVRQTPEDEPAVQPAADRLFDSTPLAFTYENGYNPADSLYESRPQPESEPPKPPRKKGWLITLIAVLALLFAGGVTYTAMMLFGGTGISGKQKLERQLEQTWYMVGAQSIVLEFRNGNGSIKQSNGIPIFDYTIAEFTYEIVDGETIHITADSTSGDMDVTFSEDGSIMTVSPAFFGTAGESWATSASAAQRGQQGFYFGG